MVRAHEIEEGLAGKEHEMAVTKTDIVRAGIAGLLRAEKAKKSVPAKKAELGLRAEQLAERASSTLTELAHKTAEMAPSQLREAPDVVRRQLELGTAAIAARLPHEPPAPSGPIERVKASLPEAVPAAAEKVLPPVRQAADKVLPPVREAARKLDNRRVLMVAGGALVLSFVVGLSVRFVLRKKKKDQRLESIDDLADKAAAGENPVSYSAAGEDVVLRNGVSPVARPDARS